MPTKIEKDAISGQDTTGHEWDGVKELNTPLPKWWLYVFMACIVWAFGMFVLYPSIPYGTGYFHGLLGYSQRASVDAEVAQARCPTERLDGQDRYDVIRRHQERSRR